MHDPYPVFPRVFPLGGEAEIRLRGPEHKSLLAPDNAYTLRFFSKINRADDARWEVRTNGRGEIVQRLSFRHPGEYAIEIFPPGVETRLLQKRFFAVPPELAGLRPYKGDLHMHTWFSDGKEAPLAMALRAREVGLDFIAIADHDHYPSSVKGIEDAARVGLGLLLLPGEEVTIRESGGHVVALNARGWVGSLRHTPEGDEARARLAREELAGRALTPPVTPEQYAHVLWTFRQIKEFGGCAIMAHPFWEGTGARYFPPPAIYREIARDRLADAIELISGCAGHDGSSLAAAHYFEEALAGRRLAIVGCSDAHATTELGVNYTVLFARELTRESVVRAIVERRTVACGPTGGALPAIYGPFDLVEYAYFMHREYFPRHDELCGAEARLCARWTGEHGELFESSARALRLQLEDYRRNFWFEC